MKCISCSREIAENSLFCNWCGAEQLTRRKQKKLPQPKKTASGAYRMQIMVNGSRRSITADSVTECRQKAKEALESPCAAGASVTVGKLIDRFISERSNTLSPATIAGYRNIARNRLPSVMRCRADRLTDSIFQRAINDESGRGISGKTISNAVNLVKTVMSLYASTEFKVRLPALGHVEHRFLEPEQISQFIRAIHGTPQETSLLLALHGLRCSEVLGLTELDYDRKNGIIRVRSAMVKDENGNMIRKGTKTDAGYREVPILIPRLAELLRAPGSLPVKSSESMMYKAVMKACSEIGADCVGVHGLRHTFISLCAHLNIPLREVMRMSGHSNSRVTEGIYTHIAASDKQTHTTELKQFFA